MRRKYDEETNDGEYENIETKCKHETAVYTRRWFFLIGTSLVTALTIFGSKSFTVANRIYAGYFNVSLTLLDWSLLASSAGAIVVTPFFAWCFFKQSVGFRTLSITGSGSMLVSYLVIVLSIEFPKLFPLMIIANFFQGIAYTVSFTIGTSFAVLWFPDNQVSLAIACNAVSFSLGTLSGAIIPPALLENVNALSNIANITAVDLIELKQEARVDLIQIYASALGLIVLLLIFFAIFARDSPPKPPTLALLIKKRIAIKKSKVEKSCINYLHAIKSLFQDREFVLCCVAISIMYNIIVAEIVHITDIVAVLNKRIHIDLPYDVTGGAIVTGYSIICCVAAFASARVSSKLKLYKGQTMVGAFFALFSALGMTLCVYTKFFIGFCLCILTYGTSTRVFIIPLLEIITRQTYPLDETFVAVWVSVCGCIAQVFFVEITRLIKFFASPIGLLIFMCACLFISFLLVIIVKPVDKRGEVIAENTKSITERTKLLSDVKR